MDTVIKWLEDRITAWEKELADDRLYLERSEREIAESRQRIAVDEERIAQAKQAIEFLRGAQ